MLGILNVKEFLLSNKKIKINTVSQSNDQKISGKTLGFLACQNNNIELLSFMTANFPETYFLQDCKVSNNVIDLLKVSKQHLDEIFQIDNKFNWYSSNFVLRPIDVTLFNDDTETVDLVLNHLKGYEKGFENPENMILVSTLVIEDISRLSRLMANILVKSLR